MATLNPYEEARLYTTNAERERYDNLSTLFSLIISLDYLERAYVRESISEAQYAPACTRLLSQCKTILTLTAVSLPSFMHEYKMHHPAAAHRLAVGVPATIEHAATADRQSAAERAKWVAETTQNFITFMDALKLKLRAKDQLHPLLSELMRGYSRGDVDNETRPKLLNWLITLNQLNASDEISEDQARQMLFDVEAAYNSFFRALQDG